MSKVKILFLGGQGEIGASCQAFLDPVRDTGLIIDAGRRIVRMDDPDLLIKGEKVLYPDFTLLEKIIGRYTIDFQITSHAHMDHTGAAAEVARRFGIPVMVTDTSKHFMKMQARNGARERAKEEEIPPREWRETVSAYTKEALPFNLRYSNPKRGASIIEVPKGVVMPLNQVKSVDVSTFLCNHSVMETLGFVLYVNGARIVRLPDHRLNGFFSDQPKERFLQVLRSIAEKPVDVLIMDALNSSQDGIVPPEGVVLKNLEGLFRKYLNDPACPSRKVFVTCIASNELRVRGICRIVKEITGNYPASIGRSFKDIFYRNGIDDVDINTARVIMVTGHQAESNGSDSKAAVWRLLEEEGWHGLKIQPGDMMVFSSRAIPGNEAALKGLVYRLNNAGVVVILNDGEKKILDISAGWKNVFEEFIHVSGHGHGPEKAIVMDILKPKFVLPGHAEKPDLEAFVALVPKGTKCPLLNNGDMFEL